MQVETKWECQAPNPEIYSAVLTVCAVVDSTINSIRIDTPGRGATASGGTETIYEEYKEIDVSPPYVEWMQQVS
jgi:hypothetical protein